MHPRTARSIRPTRQQHAGTLVTRKLADGSVEMWVEYGGAGGQRDGGWFGSYEVLRAGSSSPNQPGP